MKTTMSLLLTSLLLLVAMPLMAEECETDADCPEGYYCAAGPSLGCACPGCAEGEECPPCECDEPEEVAGECVEIDPGFDNIIAGECSADADCPVDFTCQEVTLPCWEEWACPPCTCAGCDPEDEDCKDPPDCECPACEEPEECEDTVASMCVYTPTECGSDADCASGFECMELKECWGGGSDCACTNCVCADCPEGEECPPCECDEEAECECEEEEFEEECIVFASICFPKETSCEADGDCAEGFICMENMGGGVSGCACPDCACAPCPEGEECEPCDCPPCECEEEEEEFETEGICVPAGWDEAEFMGGGGSGGFGADTLAENAAEQSGVTKDSDEEDPEAPAGGDGAGGGGGGEEEGAADTDKTIEEKSGCTAGTSGSVPAAWLLLLALVGLATLRRRVSC